MHYSLYTSALQVAGEYDYTKAIASIYFFDGLDCPDDVGFEKYDVMPPFGPGSIFPSPDQYDPGLPPVNDQNVITELSFPPGSFIVDAMANTSTGTDRYQLGAVSLYPNCMRKPNQSPDEPFNLYCPSECDTEGWSVNNGHGVCVNTPQMDAGDGVVQHRIDQTVNFCD